MTPQEAAALLTVAAAYDNRKPDADTAQAWAMALDGLRFHDCRQVIVEHYRKSREWLMPFDVIAGVKRLRAARLTAVVEPIPPAELEPHEYAAWLRDVRRRIADGEDVRLDLARETNGAPRPAELTTTIPVRGAETEESA